MASVALAPIDLDLCLEGEWHTPGFGSPAPTIDTSVSTHRKEEPMTHAPAPTGRPYEIERDGDWHRLTIQPDYLPATVYLTEDQLFKLVDDLIKSTVWHDNMKRLLADDDLWAEIDGQVEALGDRPVRVASVDEHSTPWDEPRVASQFDREDWAS
jgi:hypothetical protein